MRLTMEGPGRIVAFRFWRKRMRQHQIFIVLAALVFLGVDVTDCEAQIQAKRLKVGVFHGNGVVGYCGDNAFDALRIDPLIERRRITASEIARGDLSSLDVLIFPGGGGGRQFNDLGALGRSKVIDFVRRDGRGLIGICAGAYLMSDTPGYTCLRLGGVSAIDMEHDERGHGLVACKISDAGRRLFPELAGHDEVFLYYYEGPLLIPARNGGPYETLGVFVSDVHLEHDSPAGVMPGKPTIVAAEAGKGRVVLSSGHPESTPGLRWMLPRMVRWVARRDLVAYSPLVVRPRMATREILFDAALRKEETALFKTLLQGRAAEKVAAMRRLVEIRSWDAARWIVGGVRSDEPEVRRAAAMSLVKLEATWAVPDVRNALLCETDPATAVTLRSTVSLLSAMAPACQ